MLNQADIDAAVSESLARTQELLAEYQEQFVRPLEDVQKAMHNAQFLMNKAGGQDGQRAMVEMVHAPETDE